MIQTIGLTRKESNLESKKNTIFFNWIPNIEKNVKHGLLDVEY